MKAKTGSRQARRPALSPIALPARALPLATLGLAAMLTLGACRKDSDSKEEQDEKDKKSESETASATEERPARRAPPADEGVDVPTEEDFEEAVANQITPESDLQKELDQLEKEIAE